MTDDVVQEFPREGSNPVVPVPKQRLSIRVLKTIGKAAFHVYGGPTEKTGFHQFPHFHGFVAELVVVPDRYHSIFPSRQVDQGFRLLRGNSKGFFQKYVRPVSRQSDPREKWLCGGVVMCTTSG